MALVGARWTWGCAGSGGFFAPQLQVPNARTAVQRSKRETRTPTRGEVHITRVTLLTIPQAKVSSLAVGGRLPRFWSYPLLAEVGWVSPLLDFDPPRRAINKSLTPVAEDSSDEVLAPTAAALPSVPLPLLLPTPPLPRTDEPVVAAKAEPWQTPAVSDGQRARRLHVKGISNLFGLRGWVCVVS